jgi:beta-lactamase superfamily II metal-dependent hydrolase
VAFLAAVAPQLALIGCGPKAYSTVVLPDADVVNALTAGGATVLRTDVSDQSGCAVADRVGRDDARPGWCDNWVVDIGP